MILPLCIFFIIVPSHRYLYAQKILSPSSQNSSLNRNRDTTTFSKLVNQSDTTLQLTNSSKGHTPFKAAMESNMLDFARNYTSVYPNPSTSQVNINLNSDFILQSIRFYNIIGRQVFPKYIIENNAISVDIHDFPSGIYMTNIIWTVHIDLWAEGDYTGSFTLPFLVRH